MKFVSEKKSIGVTELPRSLNPSKAIDCEQSLFSSKIRLKETCKRDCERDLRAAMPRARAVPKLLGNY